MEAYKIGDRGKRSYFRLLIKSSMGAHNDEFIDVYQDILPALPNQLLTPPPPPRRHQGRTQPVQKLMVDSRHWQGRIRPLLSSKASGRWQPLLVYHGVFR